MNHQCYTSLNVIAVLHQTSFSAILVSYQPTFSIAYWEYKISIEKKRTDKKLQRGKPL